MTPRLSGQIALLRDGFDDAAVSPSTVGYVEAHGTGTLVGDRAELEALSEVYAGVTERPHIGSIKANIGHTLSAAGVAGLMRAAMACYTATLPPHAGWEAWPDSVEAHLRFPIGTTPAPWTAGTRRATVSAFGFGGQNAFAVLESALPAPLSRGGEGVPDPRTSQGGEGPLLFCCSAPTPVLLDLHLGDLATALAEREGTALAATAFTVSVTRTLSRQAATFVAHNAREAVAAIASLRAALREPPTALIRVGQVGLLGPAAAAPSACTEAPFCACVANVLGDADADPLLRLGAAHLLGHSVDVTGTYPKSVRRIADVPIAGLERERYWAVDARPKPATEAPPSPRPEATRPAAASPPADATRPAATSPPAEATRPAATSPPAEATRPAATSPPAEATRPATQRPESPPAAPVNEGLLTAVARIGGRPCATVRPEHRLMADLGFDSVMFAELVSHLSRVHGVHKPFEFWNADPRIADIPTAGNGASPNAFPDTVMTSPDPPRLSRDRVPDTDCRIEAFPEVRALETRRASWGDLYPYFRTHDGIAGAHVTIDGRPHISFAHYDYLGLNGHPDISAAAQQAIARHGTTTSASRLVAGELSLHGEFERELAAFLGVDDCVAMVSGHATNLSVISTLVGPGDLVLTDSLSHDSIVQGAIASRAARRTFPHNDLTALERIVAEARPDFRRVLIVTEGLFSMDGDVPDLAALVDLKTRHGCLLMVDEAHALGVLGPTGRGLAEHCGVPAGDVDVWMGTFSKALVGCGGYVAGSRALVHLLKHAASGFVYSVGLAPSVAAGALAALRVVQREPERVTRLRERSMQLALGLRAVGCEGPRATGTPIVPLVLGDDMRCLHVTAALAAEGIHVMPIVYPAVEREASRLRFFVTAAHTPDDLARAAAAVGRALSSVRV